MILFLKDFLFEIFTLFISTLIILFVYPNFIIFLFPCWIYRCLVTHFLQKNPKFGRLLTEIDRSGAGQNPYSNPEAVLITSYYFSDKINVSKVVKGLREKIIEPGTYPELRQKIIQKYGCHFWYNVENFKVEDHVRNLNTESPNMPVTSKQIRNLANGKLLRLPFDPERSPWEFIVVENYMDKENSELKSAVMLRVNHCLMDGYLIYNFMMKTADKPWKSLPSQNHEKRDFKTKLVDLFNF